MSGGRGFLGRRGQKRFPALELGFGIERRPQLVEFLQFLFCASLKFGLERPVIVQHLRDDMVIVQFP
jgi:hypothetical protein